MYSLPRTATAPFCPSEVKGSVAIDAGASFIKKFMRFAGPGLLVSVGYMDPGNWATDIEAGSKYGHGLLSVPEMESSWCRASRWLEPDWEQATTI